MIQFWAVVFNNHDNCLFNSMQKWLRGYRCGVAPMTSPLCLPFSPHNQNSISKKQYSILNTVPILKFDMCRIGPNAACYGPKDICKPQWPHFEIRAYSAEDLSVREANFPVLSAERAVISHPFGVDIWNFHPSPPRECREAVWNCRETLCRGYRSYRGAQTQLSYRQTQNPANKGRSKFFDSSSYGNLLLLIIARRWFRLFWAIPFWFCLRVIRGSWSEWTKRALMI